MQIRGVRLFLASIDPELDNAFYTKVLGFESLPLWSTGRSATVARQGLMLTFEKAEPIPSGCRLTIDIVGIGAYHANIASLFMGELPPVELHPPGIEQFTIRDPSGRSLSFVEAGPHILSATQTFT